MIRNVIYDMGGVLYDIDYTLTAKAFRQLGFKNFDEMYSQFNADDTFTLLEKGQITETAFYNRIQQAAPRPVSAEQIKDAWNAMLLGFRVESLDFLETIAREKTIFLLSNTNSIHLKKVLQDYKKLGRKKAYDALFTVAWYSHDINYRKPDGEIYEYILAKGGLKAEETLFIDDTEINIASAKAVGIQTHFFKSSEKIENLNYT